MKNSGRGICKHCQNDFIKKDSRQIFCNIVCVNKHNHTGKKKGNLSDETKEKIRRSVLARKRYNVNEMEDEIREKHFQKVIKHSKGKYRDYLPESILQLSSRTIRKIFKRMKLPCSRCGWNEAVCDLHHIKGKKILDANNHTNLTYLYPNCHRLFHCKIIGVEDVINLKDYIGETWGKFYYG